MIMPKLIFYGLNFRFRDRRNGNGAPTIEKIEMRSE